MVPGPKEASKPSGKVVSLILATLTGTVPFMLLCCVSISHHGGHGRCVLGRFGVCLGFCIFFMLLDALLSHFARLVIGIQPLLNEFHESRLSGT